MSANSSFPAVAVDLQRHELLRLWLLGSWAAAQRGNRFALVNLVRSGFEGNVPSFAATHFTLTDPRRVHRATGEGLDDFVNAGPVRSGASTP